MITDRELQQFAEVGAVTIDTPLSQEQVEAAAAVFDRLLPFCEPKEVESPRFRLGATCSFYQAELLDIIQHPFFEDVAKRVLKADAVYFFQTAMAITYPQPNTPFSFDQHVDIQYCLADLEAIPRRMVCSYFLWISDVNERRAPLMYRPGSHIRIAAERQEDPDLKDAVPQVAGTSLNQLKDLQYTDPIPIVARAGQVSVLTTAMVHGASVNVDSLPRKVLVLTFTAKGVEIGLPANQAEAKQAYDRELRQHLLPERKHIVPI